MLSFSSDFSRCSVPHRPRIRSSFLAVRVTKEPQAMSHCTVCALPSTTLHLVHSCSCRSQQWKTSRLKHTRYSKVTRRYYSRKSEKKNVPGSCRRHRPMTIKGGCSRWRIHKGRSQVDPYHLGPDLPGPWRHPHPRSSVEGNNGEPRASMCNPEALDPKCSGVLPRGTQT